MFNLPVSVEQSNREQQGLEARDAEASLHTDIYSAEYFEEYIGLEPRHSEKHSYWSGYQIGCREYWTKKLGIEILTQF